MEKSFLMIHNELRQISKEDTMYNIRVLTSYQIHLDTKYFMSTCLKS